MHTVTGNLAHRHGQEPPVLTKDRARVNTLRTTARTLKRTGTALAAGALTSVLALTPAAAYPDGPWFVPNKPYATTSQWVPGHNITIGDLADPAVYYENGTYYAYGTNGGGRNVPVITSPDLVNWTTNQRYTPPATSPDGRPVLNAGDYYFNDALALPGSWAKRNLNCDTAHSGCYEIWAPSVEKAANGTYVMAYAARAESTAGVDRWCIGLAHGTKPTGPFFDTDTAPFVCSGDPAGAIDPDLYKDENGKLYLYWKNEGNAAEYTSTKIWVRELNAQGNAWAPGSTQQSILTTSVVKKSGTPDAQTWEETLVENPSMVKWQGKHYLFYSAGQYSTLDYRTGYAECDSAVGPCRRVSHTPILATDARWGMGGPGGSNAFVDAQGKLRLATAAWRSERAGYDTRMHAGLNACRTIVRFFEDQVGCTSNQRFLHIGTVSAFGANGLLAAPVKSEFAWAAATRKPAPIIFTDVAHGQPFSSEIMWLAHTGITTGWETNGTRQYRAEESISRGAMAAFMYRLAGSPSFEAPATSPFTDVSVSHPFYKEITWLNSVGITTGWTGQNGTRQYRPEASITREAMAAFMYRAAGSPAYTGTAGFSDTSTSAFAKEISWAKAKGITNGNPDGTYRPADPVSRGAMAAFMYRLTQQGPLLADPWTAG